jgi:tetratricopeptide (TPR) repeat protein
MRTVSLALALVLAASTAHAQTAPPATASADAGAPTPRSASPGRQAIVRGEAAYIARNWDAALAAFREAAQQPGERTEALLDVGYTLAQRGDREGAIGSFREAIQAAIATNDAANRVRALQAIANTLEAAGRWSDAVVAWQDYVNFAEANPSISNAAYARARIEAIRRRDELEQRSAQVRARIEERRRQNARGPQPQQ